MLELEFELEITDVFELTNGVVEEDVRFLLVAVSFECFDSIGELVEGLLGTLLTLIGLLMLFEVSCGVGEERVVEDCK